MDDVDNLPDGFKPVDVAERHAARRARSRSRWNRLTARLSRATRRVQRRLLVWRKTQERSPSSRRAHRRRRARLAKRAIYAVLAVLAALIVFAVVWGIVSGIGVFRSVQDARSALTDARAAFQRRDAVSARNAFLRAQSRFQTAERRLGSAGTIPLRLTPIVATHVQLGRSLSAIGKELSAAGVAAADAFAQFSDGQLRLPDGRLDLASMSRAASALDSALPIIANVDSQISHMPKGWVVGPLADARREVLDAGPGVVEGLRRGRSALASLPAILAEGGHKRYLIAFANLSELRGTGGFFGFATILGSTDGKLELENFSGSPVDTFPKPSSLTFPDWFPADFRREAADVRNVNLTTDFPTAGMLLTQVAAPVVGGVDGVLGVDPTGIAALLGVTGPISVPTWPEPITADNVSRIAQHDVYVQITDRKRQDEFFSQLVRATFDRFVVSPIAFDPTVLGRLGSAVRRGDVRMYSVHESDQAAMVSMGLDGSVDRASQATDVLSLVTENGSGNKIDWYLHRRIRYRVALDPRLGTALGRLDATLRNDAPGEGLPNDIIGSSVVGVRPGTSTQIFLVVRSPYDEMKTLSIKGVAEETDAEREGSLVAYRDAADIPAKTTITLAGRSEVKYAMYGAGRTRRYQLYVMPQPIAHPDELTVDIPAPRGWTLQGQSHWEGTLRGDVVLDIRLRQTWRAWLFESAVLNPARILGRLF